jgi:hypothetical protein
MAKSIPKVTGMDWILEQFNQTEMSPDEFTVEMIVAKLGGPHHPVRNRMKRMHEKGELTCRKILIKGRYVNVYKKVED